MPLQRPCTTCECQEAALAALRAQSPVQPPASDSSSESADAAAERPSVRVTKMLPGGLVNGLPADDSLSPTAAAALPKGSAPTSPPLTPASHVDRALSGLAAKMTSASGGSGSNSGPISPNRAVRFSDEEDAVRDNLHVGLHEVSRSSSVDSLHRSYDAAVERRHEQLPATAGGFHVKHTAGGKLQAVSSSARWEDVVGYSRAVKKGPFIFVSGTSAVDQETGRVMFRRDPYKQTQLAFTIIEKALAQVGASLDDVVRTRLFVRNMARDGEHISRAHGKVLGHVKPASTMLEVSRLVHEDILVLIEADAILGDV